MSCATGNWLTAGTWALVDSTSYSNSETTTGTPPTSAGTTARSNTFTPGAITVDAIAIKMAGLSNTTGTLTANIYNSTGAADVAGTSVTINKSDLNATFFTSLDGGWITFKFASPVTLIAATAYAIQLIVSNATGITVFVSTSSNWSRALRTTTTQAPVAADDLIVAGEHTGAGTGNNFTVTMNETATTDYGSNTTSTVTPALAICKRGTLKFNDASAANPKLRLSGHLIVYNGGTLNIGIVATPIPRDSTAVLEFDCTADGDFGLVCRNGSTIALQGLSRTSGKNILACKLAANASASGGSPSTSTLTIDTDTGWLSGDQIAIASTSQTASDCETGTLNADAGASSIVVNNMTAGVAGTAVPPTSNRGLLVAHSGTSPTQAEIILLTHNVKVRSTSSTAMAYVFIDCSVASGTTAVDIDWTEFYYLGENVANKRGFEVNYIATFAGSVNIQYSSFHDCEDNGVYFNPNITNTTFSNNAMWNLATVTGPACIIAGSSTATNWIIDSNILIRTSNSNGWTLGDIGGTFTNNTVVGATALGLTLGETSAVIGTMTGNAVHSNTGSGVQFTSSGMSGTISGQITWRNNGAGITITTGAVDAVIDNMIAFGNGNANMTFGGSGDVQLKSPIFNGDTSFSTAFGITVTTQGTSSLLIDNGDFSTVAGIKTAHAIEDFNIATAAVNLRAVLRNTKLGATAEINSQSNLSNNGYVASQRHDQAAGGHKTWMRNGTIQTDAVIYNNSAPSLLMTPTAAARKLESAPQFQGLKVAVNNGSTATVSCYVRKSATYNGNQPRLIQKANPALGLNDDVVLATLVGGTGSWIQMSGTTSTATDDGAWEIVVDCDGTAGTVNIDDFAVS